MQIVHPLKMIRFYGGSMQQMLRMMLDQWGKMGGMPGGAPPVQDPMKQWQAWQQQWMNTWMNQTEKKPGSSNKDDENQSHH